MYRQRRDILTGGTQTNGIERIADSAWIPADEGNTDWMLYQQWLAEGNTPEPAA